MYRPDPWLLPRIAATELDTVWRNELVWGRVHDENADAMGGVAGHAGLFSTALDLSVFARMMLNGGSRPRVHSRRSGGRAVSRGPAHGRFRCPRRRRSSEPSPPATTAPRLRARSGGTRRRRGHRRATTSLSAAFGHTGFTGTSLWIDPELDLWVVLLTNRVHPTRENQKHVALRRAVHDAVARSITDLLVRPRGDEPADRRRTACERCRGALRRRTSVPPKSCSRTAPHDRIHRYRPPRPGRVSARGDRVGCLAGAGPEGRARLLPREPVPALARPSCSRSWRPRPARSPS